MRQPVATLEHVHKSYRAGEREQVVLRDVSLEVAESELLAILGPSGCGKTTLLNLVGGLDRADAGTVRSCGLDLTHASRRQLTAFRARELGFIFQFYNLLPTLTALENVEAGVTVAGVERARARRRARELLLRVGMGAVADHFPAQLSGGEQQRVAIVRALAKEPRLVLADEPTGNLDEQAAGEVLGLVRELGAQTGATFVVVTHNPAVADACSRVVHMSGGRAVEEARA
jgi:putative ABC transport system ATP-binding protein